MSEELISALFFFSFLLPQVWAFRNLPKERWQMIASFPVRKISEDNWYGVNLTFYGFFISTGYTLATYLFILLSASLGVSIIIGFIICGTLSLICIPSAKLIANMVEKKKHSFTAGGASFVGMIMAPLILMAISSGSFPFRLIDEKMILPILSSLAISYAFGESIGRLGCISFGCCYGKPLDSCGPILRKIFENHSFVFTGRTKKALYSHGLENRKLLPIQALTSTLNLLASASGLYLFLSGHYLFSFVLVFLTIAFWRFISEFLRADHRGDGKITAYQIMSLLGLAEVPLIIRYFPASASYQPNLVLGLKKTWDPLLILILCLIWWILLFVFGRSRVTASRIDLFVIGERI